MHCVKNIFVTNAALGSYTRFLCNCFCRVCLTLFSQQRAQYTYSQYLRGDICV